MLALPVFLGLFTCWMFGYCRRQRQACLDDCREIDHRCYNCKSLIATKKSLIGRKKRGIKGKSYLSSRYSSSCSSDASDSEESDLEAAAGEENYMSRDCEASRSSQLNSGDTEYYDAPQDQQELSQILAEQELKEKERAERSLTNASTSVGDKTFAALETT